VDPGVHRFDVYDTDNDSSSEKRWYYGLYAGPGGAWFWEPRPPTPAESVDPHALGGMSWKPQALRESDWPPTGLCGPFERRREAITEAKAWFEAFDSYTTTEIINCTNQVACEARSFDVTDSPASSSRFCVL